MQQEGEIGSPDLRKGGNEETRYLKQHSCPFKQPPRADKQKSAAEGKELVPSNGSTSAVGKYFWFRATDFK